MSAARSRARRGDGVARIGRRNRCAEIALLEHARRRGLVDDAEFARLLTATFERFGCSPPFAPAAAPRGA